VLKVKGHSGYDSCTQCIEEGEYLKNRSCFPYTASTEKKRTHDYINMKYEEHHVGNTISILSDLPGVNIVDAFALDYMHLVCIGIMKKLIQLWMKKGPLNVRLPSSVVKIISNQLVAFKKSVPCDFSRKSRALNELPRFNATELRQILLYTGQVVFKDNINSNCYMHFMALNIAITILLSNKMKKSTYILLEIYSNTLFKNLKISMEDILFRIMFMGFYISLMTIPILALSTT